MHRLMQAGPLATDAVPSWHVVSRAELWQGVRHRDPAPELSVVVPAHNEAGNTAMLLAEIHSALDGKLDYEIVYVDDGSTDDTSSVLTAAAESDPRLRIARHARNCGQSTALHTGVCLAQAPWIATLDGDGQNDPADIPRLFAMLCDPPETARLQLVAGYRKRRRDGFTTRLSSRIANAVRGRVLRDATPDTGCGLKVFSRDAFLSLPYFDHMHRFLPALILRGGGGVVSLPVEHRLRRAGRSHYGIHNRLWVGIVDLFGVMWLARRAERPTVLLWDRPEPRLS